MLRPQEFAVVQAASPGASLRTSGRWLSMTAAWTASPDPTVRLGITVSRRMARRSIDRSLVKRIVREAFRHMAESLERHAARSDIALAVNFRLKRPVGASEPASRPPLTAWRRALRSDAEAGLAAVERHLVGVESHA